MRQVMDFLLHSVFQALTVMMGLVVILFFLLVVGFVLESITSGYLYHWWKRNFK